MMMGTVGVGWYSNKAEAASDWNRRAAAPAAPVASGTTSDKYRAELYDEVWQRARDMGYGNVTEALVELERLKAAAPVVQAAPRCQCCGYLVTQSEHRGCLRAAAPPAHPDAELVEALRNAKPEWAKMNPVFVADTLRRTTMFDADMIEEMLQFAADIAALAGKGGE
jgi:hypothetical protein